MSSTPLLDQIQLPTPSDTPRAMEQDESSPTSYAHHSTTWTPVDGMTPISTNPSKKRSRDDTAFDPETDGSYFAGVQTPAPILEEEEPIYGEGMVLLNPKTGMAISAESQTGTWYEEKVERKAFEHEVAVANFRPKLPTSRKSVRMSQSSIRLPIDTTVASAPASPPKTAVDRPEFDEATMALGIGWTKVSSEDEAVQAAARGWARYLENHYARHIHGAQILLKSSGLNAYLVGCQEGYFLFSEDLLEGKLVGRTWESCLQNLKAQPMLFEGEEVLRAERTPGPETVPTRLPQRNLMENWADYERLNSPQAIATHGGMDLD
ncbi:hypothetical protein LTR10_020082 [Elasticomyces elasticus]|uniref:Uncharacterized protein n=1 Tax=Exophiala sideris TaxID=1016849 RepID=A0ABR0IVX5_9EURO|nr:hypothetical protein LTR10_020082 [Elasticomyces elasticus]KAK5021336.1 hypothetical protein LTS07_011079 [Exophiala sideris]KAK5024284.1 hypothetical protein LTR13_010905 [Exophiala sideris]KAK5049227.1 hypothetical protein LTR69_011102 [Exophiala sideris]KAK5176539.1 hypothetical protein LTR44_010927 [Eurotiomycetes sp. CCFEE 6388]